MNRKQFIYSLCQILSCVALHEANKELSMSQKLKMKSAWKYCNTYLRESPEMFRATLALDYVVNNIYWERARDKTYKKALGFVGRDAEAFSVRLKSPYIDLLSYVAMSLNQQLSIFALINEEHFNYCTKQLCLN